MSIIAVEIREHAGKGVARKLRAAGRIPAVLYGQGRAPVSLTLEPTVLERLLHSEGHNTLFELEGGSAVEGRTVLVKAMQRHPVRGELIHADLYEVDIQKKITVSVSVHLVGTPIGVSLDGGLVEHTLREVELDCLPRAIPDSIDLEISELHLGETLHVSDLPLLEGVEMKTQTELAVVSVVAPKAEEEPVVEEPVEGEELPEGEVDEDGAAAPAEGADGGGAGGGDDAKSGN
ncbi:MAG: 50S ribosomal protein L25 [Myxococcota bacterium]|nr:50S ribosomal protein L25 [Myxococcota bacterium]